jgi:hypothetical protein
VLEEREGLEVTDDLVGLVVLVVVLEVLELVLVLVLGVR